MPVEIAAIHGRKECVAILFPVTSHVARFADWSVDGIMQHVKSAHLHKSEEPAWKALGDAAFERKDYAHALPLYIKAMAADPKNSTLYAKRIDSLPHFNLVDFWDGALVPRPLQSSVSACRSRRKSFMSLCWQGVKIGQILASQVGVSASAVGSNLQYLNEECTEAKSFFKYMSSYKATGDAYVARAAGESAKVSKIISKVLGGASSTLSYGGSAFRSVGFSLQRLHPEAQSGGSVRNAVVETVTVESVEEATKVMHEWKASEDLVIADVPPHMDRDLVEKIMKLFKDATGLQRWIW